MTEDLVRTKLEDMHKDIREMRVTLMGRPGQADKGLVVRFDRVERWVGITNKVLWAVASVCITAGVGYLLKLVVSG